MSAHAKLSASSAHRWIACPRCVALEASFPDEHSPYAAEGTLAHAFACIELKHDEHELDEASYIEERGCIHEDPLFTDDMPDHIAFYVDHVHQRLSEQRKQCPDAKLLIEERLRFDDYVPGGFGTGDAVILADDTIEIIDLKYGQGVEVDAENNPQLRLYALGALQEFGHLYDIRNAIMTICQPRRDHVSVAHMRVDELLQWAKDVVKPAAQAAMNDAGAFHAGDHCKFCKARHTCRARADHQLELAKHDFAKPDLLTLDEIADVVLRLEAFDDWAKDVRGYALDQALKGAQLPGLKLVEGRSTRKYSDTDRVAETLLTAGYPEPLLYERSLLGITAMEKVVGKKRFMELVGKLVEKPAGKPTLAPESDKRPAINGVHQAIRDFAG